MSQQGIRLRNDERIKRNLQIALRAMDRTLRWAPCEWNASVSVDTNNVFEMRIFDGVVPTSIKQRSTMSLFSEVLIQILVCVDICWQEYGMFRDTNRERSHRKIMMKKKRRKHDVLTCWCSRVCEEIKKKTESMKARKPTENTHTQLNNQQQELIHSTKEVRRRRRRKSTNVNRFGLLTQNNES